MKNINFLLRGLVPLLMAAAVLVSCADDDDNEGGSADKADKVANDWIYKRMKEIYLWNDELPSSVNYNRDYDKFFKDLLSKDKDGKHDGVVDYYYSSVQRYYQDKEASASTRAVEYKTSSFGFDYIITQSFLYDPEVSEDNRYAKKYATVVWVLPESPADKAKLKRGDHIYKINGSEIPQTYYGELLSNLTAPMSGTATVNLTVCELELKDYVEAFDEYGNTYTAPRVTRDNKKNKTVSVKSEFLSENPVFLSTILPSGVSSKTIGYLVYNQFNSGAKYTNEEGLYDEYLVAAFRDFKEGGVEELIVDLRYNPGGQTSSCQLLASLIVPETYKDKVFHIMEFNENKKDSTVYYSAQTNSLGLSKIYVLASNYSASASEVFLHCLRASGVEVIHIGSTTEGKNVGQSPQTTETYGEMSQFRQSILPYDYTYYPITFYIKDSNGTTYPSSGIDPEAHNGYVIHEEFEYDFKALGDTEEPMLAAAISHINTGKFPTRPAGRGSSDLGRSATAFSLGKGIPRNVKPSKGYIEDIKR